MCQLLRQRQIARATVRTNQTDRLGVQWRPVGVGMSAMTQARRDGAEFLQSWCFVVQRKQVMFDPCVGQGFAQVEEFASRSRHPAP